ncbi:hypothetical protein IQ269_10100 [Tychonema sp. LEGE 07199]|uniref:hypothetical protein n=1 Tax=unclassified Tychonema TaxID=2642144 RepID=UPI001881E132|nr:MULTISPECIES: hypothetical protein [unclassified Tychonema]MBE9121160.1 hypothetical protein [Tychonema sp. LEGE 07199]MBE9133327.1 hypothetical protein [Tychonema sp. LEGE 07196]
MKEEGRRKKEEGRRKREEGRGKREEGRGKREEGRGKREEGIFSDLPPSASPPRPSDPRHIRANTESHSASQAVTGYP